MFKNLTTLEEGKKLYFVSDLHFGAPNPEKSLIREKKIVRWINSSSKDAAAFFFLGDIFDFWFEYRHVVPKGYTRFLGKLMELRDRDIPIYFFTGNHDLWMYDYFPKEFDIPVFREPLSFRSNEKLFHIGHGDGLGPGDYGYKRLKKIFTNPFIQLLFRVVHPDLGIGFANAWSNKSRLHNAKKDYPKEIDPDKELLYQYSKSVEEHKHHDFYVFGHRHVPLSLQVNKASCYFNLGEWVNHCTYGVFDGHSFELWRFED